jgi:hypothetical protein
MVRILVPPYSPVGYKGQEEQEILKWCHSTDKNNIKSARAAAAAAAADVFDDHSPAGDGTGGSSSSSHPSFGPRPVDHIILDPGAGGGAPPARGVRHHDDHHHDKCSNKEDQNNNGRQDQHHQIMDRDFAFSRGEESRQDDDCLVDTRTTTSGTVDETRSRDVLLQSFSSYEILSCLDRPREGGRRMKDSDYCLPSYKQIAAVSSSSSTNFDSVDHHDDKRLEGGLWKLHHVMSRTRTPSSLVSSSSLSWPSCNCHQNTMLDHGKIGAPCTCKCKFSNYNSCFQGDATTATQSLSLESSQKLQHTWCACHQEQNGSKQQRYNDDLPLVLLINRDDRDSGDSSAQEPVRIGIQDDTITPGIRGIKDSTRCQLCDGKKGQCRVKTNLQDLTGEWNDGRRIHDDNNQSALLINREHVINQEEGSYRNINHPFATATTSPRRNHEITATTSNSTFGRLAQHTTKSYTLRQRASSAIRERKIYTSSQRHCVRDPSPFHERLARQETYSSAMKRSQKSPQKSSRPFYSYVNPKTSENRMLPSSNSYDTSIRPVFSSPTKIRSPAHSAGTVLVSRSSMNIPHVHSLPPSSSSARLNHDVTKKMTTDPFAAVSPEWFPKDRNDVKDISQNDHQHNLKVRHPSPTMRPFRTIVTAGSFKGDDISVLTDSVTRFNNPKSQMVHAGAAAVVNAAGDPWSCDTLSSSSHDDGTALGIAPSVVARNQAVATALPAPAVTTPRQTIAKKNEKNSDKQSNNKAMMKEQQQEAALSHYYDTEKIEQKKKELEAKQNDLYHRLAHQDTVSSSRIKSKPLGEKILSSYEKSMIAEERARSNARRRQRSASVQPERVFERLTTRGMEAALKNQLIIAKLVQDQKEWM